MTRRRDRRLLEPLKGGTGFTGRSPGGKSRWTGKTQKMIRLEPEALSQNLAPITSPAASSARVAASPLAHR